MAQSVYFKSRRGHGGLGGNWRLPPVLLCGVLAAFWIGCAGSRTYELGKNDLADLNLRGPVRTMLVEIGPSDYLGNPTKEPGPREYREYDRDGNQLQVIRFRGDLADTSFVRKYYYESDGTLSKTITGSWAGRNRWIWVREEFAYDSLGRRKWSAQYYDTARGAPHMIFCYSRDREDEKECLEYWQHAKVVKVVYLNDQDVAQGEQWIRRGISQGVIRYEIDTVERRGEQYVAYRLPVDNINGRADRYAVNYYNYNGALARQWEYRQIDSTAPKYRESDLTDIRTYDDTQRLASEVFVGAGGGADPIVMYRYEYNDKGDMERKLRVEFASFRDYLEGDELRKRLDERYEYRTFDTFGNWKYAVTATGDTDQWHGMLRRTFTYYER